MKQKYRKLSVLMGLAVGLLLGGCGSLSELPKPPKPEEFLAEEASPAPATLPAQAAADQSEAADPEKKPVTSEEAVSDAGRQAAEAAVVGAETPLPDLPSDENAGYLISIRRNGLQETDPENHTVPILSMAWDSVYVKNSAYPEAAGKISERLGIMEDDWYTGNDASESNVYGYNNLLALAEDDYGLSREFGGEVKEYMAIRSVEVLRADERFCVFLITDYRDLGEAPGETLARACCFDAKTGELMKAERQSDDPEGLKAAVLAEFAPNETDQQAKLTLRFFNGEGSTASEDEFVDVAKLNYSENEGFGSELLLNVEGRAEDLAVYSVFWGEEPSLMDQAYYAGYLQDTALKLEMSFAGDLPGHAIRYRDAAGEHILFMELSGEDGSPILTSFQP